MQQDRQQQYVELYESKYEDFIQEGKSPSQSQALAYEAVEHAKEIIEGVSFMFDEGYYVNQDGSVSEVYMEGSEEVIGEFYTNIRHTVVVDDIVRWNELDAASKELALFNMGVDINLPWRLKYGLHPMKDGAPKEVNYVEGSERLDSDWCNGARCSMEAMMEYQGIIRGRDHFKTLKEMSRQ